MSAGRRRARTFAIVIALLALAFNVSVAVVRHSQSQTEASAATPLRVPTDDDVVDLLPPGSNDQARLDARALRRELRTRPRDLRLAVRVAEADVRLARRFGDPRYFGQAESALGPWWKDPSPPAPVLLVRATIRQSLHDFDGALVDLGRLVTADPRSAQGWLTRAVVLTVRGDYDSAAASCERLAGLTSDLERVACLANVDSMRGQAKAAYASLTSAWTASGLASGGIDGGATSAALTPLAETAVWVETTLGEIAGRAGDPSASMLHLWRALAFDRDDTYALGALSDLFLDVKKYDAVVELLRTPARENVDGLLLRLALAERASGDALAKAHAEALRARFTASRARGDSVHRREESRFELAFGANTAHALELAQANWQVQKEPWDMRVFCEAALAANDAKAARPVLDFVATSGFEEPAIAALVQRIKGLTP